MLDHLFHPYTPDGHGDRTAYILYCTYYQYYYYHHNRLALFGSSKASKIVALAIVAEGLFLVALVGCIFKILNKSHAIDSGVIHPAPWMSEIHVRL